MAAPLTDSTISIGLSEEEQAAQHEETLADVDSGVGMSMSDAGYEIDSASATSTLLASSARDYAFENGRRYYRFHERSYYFPNDDLEQDREDRTHALIISCYEPLLRPEAQASKETSQRTQWHVTRSHEGIGHVMESQGKEPLDEKGLHGKGLQGVRTPTDYEGLYRRGFPPIDRNFVLNSNSISYILVIAQYFRALPGDTHRTYQDSLPKTPQTPNVLKLASITTDCERYISFCGKLYFIPIKKNR